MDYRLLEPETAELSKRQFEEAKGPTMVTCECGRSMPIRFLFRCYFCGVYQCETCAPGHFGQTRDEYYRKNGRPAAPAPEQGKEQGT